MLTPNQQKFLDFMRDSFPETYKEAMLQNADSYNSQLGLDTPSTRLPMQTAVPKKSWFEGFTDSIKKIAPALIQYKTQKNILKVQLQRAKQGLPPLDTSALAPTIRIQPELTPEMYADVKKYVVPAAIGIAALLVGLIWRKKKR